MSLINTTKLVRLVVVFVIVVVLIFLFQNTYLCLLKNFFFLGIWHFKLKIRHFAL